MDSKSYWKLREENNRRNSITDEKEIQRNIDQISQSMIDECSRQIDSWMQKYAKTDGITLAEAKKRVSKLDIEEYERYARELVERASKMRKSGLHVTESDFTPEENEQMRLYNLTMKVNRLEMLKSKLGLNTVTAGHELRNYLGQKLGTTAQREAERQAGILGKSVRLTDKKVKALVNASYKNATFSQRIWKNMSELKGDLDKSITSALIRGSSSRDVARDIKTHFNDDIKKAGKASMRLAVTEMARVEIGVQQDAIKSAGFSKYQFNAVGPHPCEVCRGLNGKKFEIDKMMPGENAPPMHPWCHCSISAAAEDRDVFDAWLDSGAAREGVGLEEFKRSNLQRLPKGAIKINVSYDYIPEAHHYKERETE